MNGKVNVSVGKTYQEIINGVSRCSATRFPDSDCRRPLRVVQQPAVTTPGRWFRAALNLEWPIFGAGPGRLQLHVLEQRSARLPLSRNIDTRVPTDADYGPNITTGAQPAFIFSRTISGQVWQLDLRSRTKTAGLA